MLGLVKRLHDNEVADMILRKHINHVLENNVVCYMESMLRKEMELGVSLEDSIFPLYMTITERQALIEKIANSIQTENVMILSETEMYILIKTIERIQLEFSRVLKQARKNNIEKAVAPWRLKNESEQTYLKISLFAELDWNMETVRELVKQYPIGMKYLMDIEGEMFLIPIETPYGLVDFLVTNEQYKTLMRLDQEKRNAYTKRSCLVPD